MKRETKEIKIKKTELGITLIALVVTIIVLIILAGVSINLVLGDNGIITLAQKASENYIEGQNEELANTKDLFEELNLNIGETVSKTTTIDFNGTVVIPEGYKLAKDSAKDVNKGVVIEDVKGNQYVWIPCNEENYKRTEWEVEDDNARSSCKFT